MDSAEILPILRGRLRVMLSAERAEHSRGVALLAAELCVRHGIPTVKGSVAGLAHDICKEMPKSEQRALAQAWDGDLSGSAFMIDKLLHGPAAASMLRRDFAFSEEDVLEAIASHTVGRPGMGALAIIVYCADKMEPGRAHVNAEFRDRCLLAPLEEMLRLVVADVIVWIESKGLAVAGETLELYKSLTIPVSSK
jgi:predicted HD superfamily hydrolase involved in NAD metabolism